MQSKCAVCGIKTSRFVKEQKAQELLSNLGIKTPLDKIPLNKMILWTNFINFINSCLNL